MTYTIGQIEEVTGIKPHILRYWEDVVPGFAPKKDLTGRRSYSQRDVEKIFRLKYLIYARKMTAEEAGKQILQEAPLVQDNAEILLQIYECREALSKVLLEIKKPQTAQEK